MLNLPLSSYCSVADLHSPFRRWAFSTRLPNELRRFTITTIDAAFYSVRCLFAIATATFQKVKLCKVAKIDRKFCKNWKLLYSLGNKEQANESRDRKGRNLHEAEAAKQVRSKRRNELEIEAVCAGQ